MTSARPRLSLADTKLAVDLGNHVGNQVVAALKRAFSLTDSYEQDLEIAMLAIAAGLGAGATALIKSEEAAGRTMTRKTALELITRRLAEESAGIPEPPAT